VIALSDEVQKDFGTEHSKSNGCTTDVAMGDN